MMRCLIADDEAPARARLTRLLAPYASEGRLSVAATAGDGVEALEMLSGAPFDLAFLDVQMPGLDGFAVLERLAPEQRPAIVFTTAYDTYAVRAFEENAVDYLLKPIARDRLDQAIVRVEARHQPAKGTAPQAADPLARLFDYLDALPRPAPAGGDYLKQISVPFRDRLLVIPVGHIVTAEVQEGITRLYTTEGDTGPRAAVRHHLVSHTLDHLEAHLDPDAFMRVHRAALVQMAHIREMVPWFSGRYKVILTGGHEVIASRERSRLLKERLIS